jgi:hypothetical protein
MRLAVLLCVLGLVSACAYGGGGLPTPARPSTVPALTPPPPSPPATGVISIGEEVIDTLTSPAESRVYELTAPSNGTLVARVSCEQALELYFPGHLSESVFESDGVSIIGKLPVVAGQQYGIVVDHDAPWDYGGVSVRFVLTTSIE